MTVLMLQDVLCEKWQETFVKYIWGFFEIYARGLLAAFHSFLSFTLINLIKSTAKKGSILTVQQSHKQHIE